MGEGEAELTGLGHKLIPQTDQFSDHRNPLENEDQCLKGL